MFLFSSGSIFLSFFDSHSRWKITFPCPYFVLYYRHHHHREIFSNYFLVSIFAAFCRFWSNHQVTSQPDRPTCFFFSFLINLLELEQMVIFLSYKLRSGVDEAPKNNVVRAPKNKQSHKEYLSINWKRWFFFWLNQSFIHSLIFI